jgi:hypothetical protein
VEAAERVVVVVVVEAQSVVAAVDALSTMLLLRLYQEMLPLCL